MFNDNTTDDDDYYFGSASFFTRFILLVSFLGFKLKYCKNLAYTQYNWYFYYYFSKLFILKEWGLLGKKQNKNISLIFKCAFILNFNNSIYTRTLNFFPIKLNRLKSRHVTTLYIYIELFVYFNFSINYWR